jgi:hypothetical protein
MRPAAGRTLAQLYCLVVGLVLVAVGALGFIAHGGFGDAGDGSGQFLGLAVNGWHNVVHIASGLLLLALWSDAGRARAGALAFGVLYGAVAVWGLITGDSVLGIVAIDAEDNVLHVVLSATALIAGLASPAASYRDRDATRSRLTIYHPSRPPGL